MRKLTILRLAGILGLLCLATAAQQPATFHGEISDSQCALNVHSLTKSHEEMLKSKSGAAGNTPATCSIYCASYLGGQFVLTAKSGHVYHLDNQDMPRKFVGEKVILHGIVDSKGDMIHVVDIEGQ